MTSLFLLVLWRSPMTMPECCPLLLLLLEAAAGRDEILRPPLPALAAAPMTVVDLLEATGAGCLEIR